MKKILLAGQQNSGKSTIFNMLTGARQHVANYPGVTIEKKTGYFKSNNETVELIDLPGTYSLSSFSPEECVTRKMLLEPDVDLIFNVVDSVNLDRALTLTLQMIELGKPLVLVLNMIDIANAEGIEINSELLAKKLKLPVIKVIAAKSQGKNNIYDLLGHKNISQLPYKMENIDPAKHELTKLLNEYPLDNFKINDWSLNRILESDTLILQQLKENLSKEEFQDIQSKLDILINKLEQELKQKVSDYMINTRFAYVQQLLTEVIVETDVKKTNLSERIDHFVLNKFFAPFFLIGVIFLIYELSIVKGYELTNYTWPYLASLREFVAGLLPEAGFLYDPYVRSLGLWIVDSANTLLNYVPIFLILFALIAVLEDSGYMARIAFIVDKILSRFGLHGQSTLPLILSGVFAGGCAVPGIMATKGIPDNRARMATILTVPFMNCLAKVPLYTLLLGIFFQKDKALMMFYISTISIIAALLVAKLLTKTVLKKSPTAPFIMELPRYHIPSIKSVLIRAIERTWTYIKKVGTIVVAVSTVIFVLLQFPGISEDQKLNYEQQATSSLNKFYKSLEDNSYLDQLTNRNISSLINYYTDHKRAKLNARGSKESKAVADLFKKRNTEYYKFIKPPKGDKAAKKVRKELRKLTKQRSKIRRNIKEDRLEASLLGRFGRSLEPITKFAGFNWKINVALLSSFVARESSVATLGVLYQQSDSQNEALEQRMGNELEEENTSSLAAVALILFFILYPPCLAAVMVIKLQTGHYRWMLLAIILPTILGFSIASFTFTVGKYFNLSGIFMMSTIYFSSLILLLTIGLKNVFYKSNKLKLAQTEQNFNLSS